jgi:hypothetical protein
MLSRTGIVLGKSSAKQGEVRLEQSRGQIAARGILGARFTPEILGVTCSPSKASRQSR